MQNLILLKAQIFLYSKKQYYLFSIQDMVYFFVNITIVATTSYYTGPMSRNIHHAKECFNYIIYKFNKQFTVLTDGFAILRLSSKISDEYLKVIILLTSYPIHHHLTISPVMQHNLTNCMPIDVWPHFWQHQVYAAI